MCGDPTIRNRGRILEEKCLVRIPKKNTIMGRGGVEGGGRDERARWGSVPHPPGDPGNKPGMSACRRRNRGVLSVSGCPRRPLGVGRRALGAAGRPHSAWRSGGAAGWHSHRDWDCTASTSEGVCARSPAFLCLRPTPVFGGGGGGVAAWRGHWAKDLRPKTRNPALNRFARIAQMDGAVDLYVSPFRLPISQKTS